MSDVLTCNIKSDRAKKARTAKLLDLKLLRQLIGFLVLGLIGAWVFFVAVQDNPVANLLLIPLGILSVLLCWYYGELNVLPATKPLHDARDMSEVLSRRLLARIGTNQTPKQLAKIIATEQGGYFFSSRFGTGRNFLDSYSSDDEGSTALVWSKALVLANQSETTEVDSGILAGALILSIPSAESQLNMIQLDEKDITNGVEWFAHVRRMIERANEKSHYGGVGRDLSFGWAPVLNHVGFNITESIQSGGYLRRPVASRQEVVDQLLRVLAQPGRRNAAIVGEPGVGKTTLIYSLAQKLLTGPNVPPELAYQQVITLDAANIIARAKGRGQIEELLIRIFNEAVHAKNVTLFLDEAQLFLRDGTGSVDLSNLLLPVLQGGAIKVIISLTDQEWLRLSQENPSLTQLMNRVVVRPLNQEETVQVVEDETILLETRNKLTYMYQSIEEAYKLADRFIHDQAFPGKAIKLLEAAANFPEQQYFITTKSVRQAVEKSFDVKVQTADTSDERDVLLNLEDKIHMRMINQKRAVKLVSDALRRARSGVRNENRPIGTFLFLGPTGVGKTELSKALADVYFGGEDRIVRIDLNEYSHSDDTNRLLAIGSTDPFSLCAQIAKQPFSVVLLDEIEKANPNVLNLLLQMLDEGILRDAANKPISFRDAIIIATSNAGAAQIRQHIEAGQSLEQFEDKFVDELINADVFRPEFLNRFDEIVLFRPLTKKELTQVVDLLIKRLNQALAERKITVRLTQRAKELLADRGYDPRLGARPLRRVVQRAVENMVAQKLLGGNVMPGQVLELDAPELHKALDDR